MNCLYARGYILFLKSIWLYKILLCVWLGLDQVSDTSPSASGVLRGPSVLLLLVFEGSLSKRTVHLLLFCHQVLFIFEQSSLVFVFWWIFFSLFFFNECSLSFFVVQPFSSFLCLFWNQDLIDTACKELCQKFSVSLLVINMNSNQLIANCKIQVHMMIV